MPLLRLLGLADEEEGESSHAAAQASEQLCKGSGGGGEADGNSGSGGRWKTARQGGLAFVWSQAECTDSGRPHPANARRPMFFKELQKVWDQPGFQGVYRRSNTLLVDDDASKATLNPAGSCITPSTWEGADEEEDERATTCPGIDSQSSGSIVRIDSRARSDGGLSKDGQLRRWLDGWLAFEGESVQQYATLHPFGRTTDPAEIAIDAHMRSSAESGSGGQSAL